MVSLWNVNSGSLLLMLLLVACTGTVLGDNYNSGGSGREYNRARPGSYCEDLSPQQFIEMDHVRKGKLHLQMVTGL